MKQQQNDKCACGSGKKAKKCCLLAEMIENAARVKGFRAAKQLQEIDDFLLKVQEVQSRMIKEKRWL